MSDHVLQLVERYRSRGVLVDSNVLLLYFVGAYQRQLVPRFKRTAQFTVEDYDLLVHFLSNFRRIVTTPNILTEVNGLLGNSVSHPTSAAESALGPKSPFLASIMSPAPMLSGLTSLRG